MHDTHPDRDDKETTVCLVTPTFNSAAYLGPTLRSILSQAGDFRLRYHVQDGGSSDGTIAILERWQERSLSGDFPPLCRDVTFTYATEADAGLYDAVNKGFAALRPKACDVLAWLNSDDILAPGALAAVVSFLQACPEASFLGGRMSHIDADGRPIFTGTPAWYSRDCMKAGLYDGRAQDFIQQEGTFWRARLWDDVHGLDASFRLAGDWDLWRRFAEHAEYYSLDIVTACHRRREGQLSADLGAYYAEVDASLARGGRAEYERMRKGVYQEDGAYFVPTGKVAALDPHSGRWSVRTCPEDFNAVSPKRGRIWSAIANLRSWASGTLKGDRRTPG